MQQLSGAAHGGRPAVVSNTQTTLLWDGRAGQSQSFISIYEARTVVARLSSDESVRILGNSKT
jgi:hypothetical protein